MSPCVKHQIAKWWTITGGLALVASFLTYGPSDGGGSVLFVGMMMGSLLWIMVPWAIRAALKSAASSAVRSGGEYPDP